jgi:hypothetical protein
MLTFASLYIYMITVVYYILFTMQCWHSTGTVEYVEYVVGRIYRILHRANRAGAKIALAPALRSGAPRRRKNRPSLRSAAPERWYSRVARRRRLKTRSGAKIAPRSGA